MLGNFSFGDYFKEDAIRFAWEFITGKDWLGIDKNRLLVTVYHTDDEAYALWHDKIGVPADRIVRIGDNKGAKYASDNFWSMGDTGPCGPCTEIFYDHDPDGSKGIFGGPPGSPDEDGDRWIEIWNLVFMQFDRAKDGTLTPLPAPSVDTGMGLERISALMQGTNDNYQIDVFRTLVGAVAALAGAEPYANPSQKVIADHIRATSFLIVDGVMPSNEGRGYVLRRIMRRAIRHGYKLGLNEPFFYKLVAPLAAVMGDAYPELRDQQARIEKAIRLEEDSFATTLDKGMKYFEFFTHDKIDRLIFSYRRLVNGIFLGHAGNLASVETDREVHSVAFFALDALEVLAASEAPDWMFTRLADVRDAAPPREEASSKLQKLVVAAANLSAWSPVKVEEARTKIRSWLPNEVTFELISTDEVNTIDGKVVFKLYDTYGFPFDLTADIARERGLTLDVAGYEREMEAQRERARSASKFAGGESLKYDGPATVFVGYDHMDVEGAKVLALYRGAQPVDRLEAGDEGTVVLDRTPFYAEGGGQAGDAGTIGAFQVRDTQKLSGTAFGHRGVLESGSLAVGDAVEARVADARRRATMRNHSATHLLHKALREVLGDHVQQKGSLVDADKTRFDFAHTQPMTAAEIAEVERRVNAEILANTATVERVLPIDEARKTGAMMLFGEKYGETVRVLDIGTSRELCGGTHVARTGDIGLFQIASEGGVAAGVRRVEAVTGNNALTLIAEQQGRLSAAAGLLRAGKDDLVDKLQQLLDRNKQLERDLAQVRNKQASSAGGDLAAQAQEIGGVKVLVAALDSAEGVDLRNLLDQIKNKLGSGIVLLGGPAGEKAALIAGVTADLVGRVKAGELVNVAAAEVGGKGGGKPEMAQAGGTQPANLAKALDAARAWLAAKLA
jgi:alanyl-tRNA synthetase